MVGRLACLTINGKRPRSNPYIHSLIPSRSLSLAYVLQTSLDVASEQGSIFKPFWQSILTTGNHFSRYDGATNTSNNHNTYWTQYIYSVELLYAPVIGPLKCSILFLYVRLFGIRREFRTWCYILLGITIAWALALELGSIFQCHPVAAAWDPLGDRSNCVPLKELLIGTNVPNICLDFIILVTPFYPIWNLQLPLRKKFLISLIFVVGAGYVSEAFTAYSQRLTIISETVFSIVRLVTLTTLETTDVTWDYFSPIVWSTVEPSIGIICVCLPTLGPLLPKSLMESVGPRSGPHLYKVSGQNPRDNATNTVPLSQFNRLTSEEEEQQRLNGKWTK